MLNPKHVATAAVFPLLLLIAACDTVEEKAEREYQESVELAAGGDVDRALIQLKSVFKLNGEHRDARMLYADLNREQGRYEHAYGHYLLVAEQYPNDVEALLNLAEIAIAARNWTEAERHAYSAYDLDPENPKARGAKVAVDYNKAVEAAETAQIADMVQTAQAILADTPDNRFAREIVIDNLVRQEKFYEAIDAIDEGLNLDPNDPQFNQLKLTLIAQTGDMARLGEQLQFMVGQFPDNEDVRTALVRWYLASGDTEGAETFVRDLVANSGEEDQVASRIGLIQFLRTVQGTDKAIEELDVLIDEGLDDRTFRMMKASLVFDSGNRDEGIAQIRGLLEGREASDETRDLQTTLARMLIATGEIEEAKGITEAVLTEDSRNVQALKMKANWLVDDDQVRDAILALRTALDQSPRDSEAITLLARAYERDGNRELMAESLALAVEASNAGAAETLRYANYLIQNRKFASAEDVLIDGLRIDRTNTTMLQSLGQIYLEMEDDARAEQVAAALDRIDAQGSKAAAAGIRTTLLQKSERTDESIKLLLNVIEDGQPGLAAQAAIIRTHLSSGDLVSAREYMDELLASSEGAENRDDVEFLNAALLAVEGDAEAAETIYTDLADRNPQSPVVWRALVSLQARLGKADAANATLRKALEEVPESGDLMWMQAGFLEQQGDFEAAIEIYDAMYETNSNSTIIANNLASLITTYYSDDENLQKAFRIARRLRGSQVPAFQDTYGWISYRLGNLNEALSHLEPAAEGLPNDPNVQYHLAKTYAAENRPEDAIEYFERALELWEFRPNEELIAESKAEIQRLSGTMTATDDSN